MRAIFPTASTVFGLNVTDVLSVGKERQGARREGVLEQHLSLFLLVLT